MCKYVCMHACAVPFVCLTVPAGWEIIHILSEPCVGSRFSESAAACACLGSFVWMSGIARTAAVSEQRIMQPAERCPSPLLHRRWRRMKRVREWEHPVIWWLSNMERERGRESAWERERNEVKWEEQIVPLTAATVPHTHTHTQQEQQCFYFQPWWLLI